MVFGLLALAVSSAYGTALTYKLGASEKACFFSNIEIAQAKIAFYFAVSAPHSDTPDVSSDTFSIRSNRAARSMSITRSWDQMTRE